MKKINSIFRFMSIGLASHDPHPSTKSTVVPLSSDAKSYSIIEIPKPPIHMFPDEVSHASIVKKKVTQRDQLKFRRK